MSQDVTYPSLLSTEFFVDLYKYSGGPERICRAYCVPQKIRPKSYKTNHCFVLRQYFTAADLGPGSRLPLSWRRGSYVIAMTLTFDLSARK